MHGKVNKVQKSKIKPVRKKTISSLKVKPFAIAFAIVLSV